MKSPWQISFRIQGQNFLPAKLNLPFTKQHQPGDIASFGLYRGQPYPYGSASYEIPPEITRENAFSHLVQIFEQHLDSLTAHGAEDWHVSIGRFYISQCNEELSLEEIQLLARLRCGLTYSAYLEPGLTEPSSEYFDDNSTSAP